MSRYVFRGRRPTQVDRCSHVANLFFRIMVAPPIVEGRNRALVLRSVAGLTTRVGMSRRHALAHEFNANIKHSFSGAVLNLTAALGYQGYLLGTGHIGSLPVRSSVAGVLAERHTPPGAFP